MELDARTWGGRIQRLEQAQKAERVIAGVLQHHRMERGRDANEVESQGGEEEGAGGDDAGLGEHRARCSNGGVLAVETDELDFLGK